MVFHRPLMHIDYYVRAYRLVRAQEFDVLHAHDLNTLPVAAAVARRTRTKLIYDAHELYPEISTLSRTERNVWKVTERRLIKRAASVITVCESIAGELETRYDVQRPTVLLNCPDAPALNVSADREQLRHTLGMEDDPRAIVLYQGGFAPNRGLPELIKAGRWLDGARIALMGSGRIENELRDLIRDERVGDAVVLTPAVPQAEVIAYATGADIGVIPYKGVGLNNYYTTPNKLFDYMAAGIAIAGSRFPEIVRFVEGLGIGVTFDPEQPRDIAFAINHLVSDPATLHEMRMRAAAASTDFVWGTEHRKLLAIYSQMTPAAGRSTAAAA
jgi:glycosyltransferase involved in cell wall biosynthesis